MNPRTVARVGVAYALAERTAPTDGYPSTTRAVAAALLRDRAADIDELLDAAENYWRQYHETTHV